MSRLFVGRYLLRFRIAEECLLPPASGSMWRGLLGRELKRMSTGAATAPRNLPDWITTERLYEYFIETPPPPDSPAMRRYPHVPHPYVIAAPLTQRDVHLPTGAHITLPIILFGKANDLLHVVILALARAARGGLGKRRARAELQQVQQELPSGELRHIFAPGETMHVPDVSPLRPPAPETDKVRIELNTPLRLQHQGRLMQPHKFIPGPFVMNIIRRHAMLHLFHGPGEVQADFRALKAASERVRLLDAGLRWHKQQRYSARQQREVPLDGLLGRFELDFSQAREVWPFLWLGQFIHAGKGTVFGLGSYRLRG